MEGLKLTAQGHQREVERQEEGRRPGREPSMEERKKKERFRQWWKRRKGRWSYHRDSR